MNHIFRFSPLAFFAVSLLARLCAADAITIDHSDSSAAQPDISIMQSHSFSDSIHTLDKIVVTASKYQRLLETAQSLSVIKADNWLGTGKSVADIIGEQTGVQTRRFGGTGSFQTVSIRGVQGSEVLILLDGIPLNSAMGGAVDLGKINPLRLREIEVYKGITPGRFGGNSIGGVINLKSNNNVGKTESSLYTSFGSYGFQNHSISIANNRDSLFSFYSSISYVHSDNDFPYVDRNSTVIGGKNFDPTTDDTIRNLKNGQYTGIELRVHQSLKLNPTHRLSTGFSTTYLQRHIPAPENKINETANYTEKTVNITSSLQQETISERVSVTPRIGYHYLDGLTFSTNLDPGFDASHGSPKRSAVYHFTNHSLSLFLDGKAPFTQHITVLPTFSLQLEDAKPESVKDNLNYGDWHSREASSGISVDFISTFNDISLKASGSIKGIYNATEGGSLGQTLEIVPAGDTLISVWSATASAAYAPFDNLHFFFNTGRYSNAPSLRERYGSKGAHIPNPELVPEIGYSSELGCKLATGNNYYELVFFYNHSKNTIILSRDGHQAKSENADSATIKGVELSTNLSIKSLLELTIQATYQNAINLHSSYKGRRLPDQPDVSASVEIDFRPLKTLSLLYRPEFKSYYFHAPAAMPDSRVPADNSQYGKLLHNLKCTYKPITNLEISLSGSNLSRSLFTGNTIEPKEGSYSWIVYPDNELCIAVQYTF